MSAVYLIPSLLEEEGLDAMPAYIADAIKKCSVFFVENERSARRYFKKIWPAMVIDDFEWQLMDEHAPGKFQKALDENKMIGIVSEAGCPGVADPGQSLVLLAHEKGVEVKPMVGPSSILLALMASGMNGQQFRFAGYLPIDAQLRQKAIRELENESAKLHSTQIFIETPYRNNQMIETLLNTCKAFTKLCIAVDITGDNEWIKTRRISEWKKNKPDIHKRPAIFLVYSGE